MTGECEGQWQQTAGLADLLWGSGKASQRVVLRLAPKRWGGMNQKGRGGWECSKQGNSKDESPEARESAEELPSSCRAV